jgi:uncharacterized membrane protein YjfL (UPF0719 family)
MMFSIPEVAFGFAYLLLGIVLLLIAKVAKDLVTPYSVDEQLTRHDNRALAASMAGYYLGVVAIFLGASIGPDPFAAGEVVDRLSVAKVMAIDCGYALVGILLLNLGQRLLDRWVLPRFSMRKEIIEDQNLGAGAVEGGAYLATALVVAGAVHGDDGSGLLSTLLYFLAGQAALLLFARFYDWRTRYDLHAELERDNVAAGVAFGGTLVALGVVLLKATGAPYISRGASAAAFAEVAAVAFVALAAAHWIADHALLPQSSLSHEIATDKNVGAALIEAAAAVGLAVIVYFSI